MEWFVGGLLFFALILISGVLYVNFKQKLTNEEIEESDLRSQEDKMEEERVKQKRLEKRQKEKLRLEQEKIRTTLRKELAPYLQGFVNQNLSKSKENLKISQYILKTGVISIKELLDYSVERKLGDGTTYKVGIVKQVGDYELSLDPTQVEHLQKYFTDYFVLFEFLQSKGLKIDHLGLTDLINQEFEKLNKIS